MEQSQVHEEARAAAIAGLEEYFARIDQRMDAISDDEFDELVDEAMRSVRPNYQSNR